jgi:hypothetical protein
MYLPTGVYRNTPVNTLEIPQALLNIDDKIRDNPLGWNGQFSPQLVEILIQHYATPNDVLFDPFLSSQSFELIVTSWLNELIQSGIPANVPEAQRRLLQESGLLDALKGGSVAVEVPV